MMHQTNRRISGWLSLFSVTAALSLSGPICFAQHEQKTVSISATVGTPPPGVTLKEALASFPDKVAFEYRYLQKAFSTDTKPFAVERTLSLEYNVTIQANDGLKHDDAENVKQLLMPVIKVGDSAPIKTANEMAKWCGAGETPVTITFGIEETETAPAEGSYSGEMVLVFEPASE